LLKEGAQRTTSGSAGVQIRRLLVVGEMALAVALVVGSGLMLKSVSTLLAVDTGFAAEHLTSFQLFLPPQSYPDGAAQMTFYQRLSESLASVPGVDSVGTASGLPPLRDLNANDTEFEGLDRDPEGPPHNIDYYQFVTDDYLETMDIRIVSGRGFRLSDDSESALVALINQKTADTFWPGENPLGRRLRPGGGGGIPWISVVGIVEDVKQGGIDQEKGTEVYFRYGQVAALFGPFLPRSMYTLVRSTLPAASLTTTLREQVAALDPSLPIGNLLPMQTVIESSISRPRFLALLLSIFAGLALFLAAIGIYGVLSYSVAERSREMGIRMAMGADRRSILGMVLSQGMTLAVVGLAVGVAGSLLMTRFLQSLLFGVSPTDPLTYSVVVVLLALVAFVACAIPALRATRVDPLTVLRYE
ncbi:MAG: FtsX-like permease family protein, partial [Acidobacteria bacterium]|nr:FtsX-like permease family protein [Acidobacteriota bacterium]